MKFNLDKLIRQNVKALKPYSSARDEFEGDASVFLDANENPYPSSYNRYPDPHQKKLKSKISEIKNINKDQIFVGNGSDEAIDLLIRAFCEPGVDEILIPQPTYGMYAVCAAINNVKLNEVSLTAEFDLNIVAVFQAITPRTKLIFLCSPNNPSGNLLSPTKIMELAENFDGLVVVDEAYIDFSNSESILLRLDQANLIVLQTLSKAWGLASLRLGMCFASKEIISVLNKIKPPYNISGLTQEVALNCLNDFKRKDDAVKEILLQRAHLAKNLEQLKNVTKIYPSDANFVLAKMIDARNIYQRLLITGIVVRDRSNVLLCDNCLRITVGAPEENQKLIDALKRL
jgi:histidinol-phosphate aminotransferase